MTNQTRFKITCKITGKFNSSVGGGEYDYDGDESVEVVAVDARQAMNMAEDWLRGGCFGPHPQRYRHTVSMEGMRPHTTIVRDARFEAWAVEPLGLVVTR